jgi:hypothetical protein
MNPLPIPPTIINPIFSFVISIIHNIITSEGAGSFYFKLKCNIFQKIKILLEFHQDLYIRQAALLVQLLNTHECINQVQAGLLCQGYVLKNIVQMKQKFPIYNSVLPMGLGIDYH